MVKRMVRRPRSVLVVHHGSCCQPVLLLFTLVESEPLKKKFTGDQFRLFEVVTRHSEA